MADFTFMHPMWLLAAFPLALLLPWLREKAQKSGLIAPHLSALLAGGNATNSSKKRWPIGALALAWLLAVLALAGPSWQKTELPAVNLAGARVLVMDMSRSMYAEDIAPSRLAQARFKALDMLPGWNEGSTGLVTYAADGYIVSPLTQDAATLKNLIPNLSPALMPIAGSNAAAGIQQAIDVLKQAGFAKGDIIVITDGMSEKEASRTLNRLNGEDYRVSILAVGTQQGAPIPIPDGSLLEQNGSPAIAKLDLAPLSEVTKATGGLLQMWQPTDQDVDNLIAFTEKPLSGAADTAKKTIEERINDGYWLIIPVLLLALMSFRRGVVLAALFLVLPIDHANANAFKTDDQQAYSQFEAGDYQNAAETFESPQWKGIAQYKVGDYQGAVDTLSTLKDPTSQYNLGNALAQAGDLKKAADTYRSLLDANPDHADAKRNLDIVEQALKQQQQQRQQNGGEQESQPQQGNQDQQDPSEGQDSQSQDGQSEQNQQGQQGQQGQQAENSRSGSEDKASESEAASNGDSQPKTEKGDQASESMSNAANDQEGPQGDDQSTESNAAIAKQSSEDGEEPNAQASANAEESGDSNGLQVSHPVLKKLEQVQDDTAALIRAQLILQSREKDAPEPTENSW